MVKFKYRIAEKIQSLPKRIKMAEILEMLHKEHGITKSQFYRDQSIKINQHSKLTVDRLYAYAIVLGCSADELLNQNFKGKSILTKHDLIINSRLKSL